MLWQLIIIQVITFLAIVFTLRQLLYAETAKEARRLKILKEETSGKQKELQAKIAETDNMYTEKLQKAEAEIAALKARADEKAQESRKEILERAKRESDNIIKTAVNTKDKIRDEIKFELQKTTPFMASRIFKEILSPAIKEDVHRELVKETAGEIRNIEKTKFDIKIKKGEIISAYPMERDEKTALLSSISQKLGYRVPFDEKEDKKLFAGVIVRLGNLVIDGSLENRLKQIEQGTGYRGQGTGDRK